MARMPDGWVVTIEPDRKALEMRISGSRELVMCRNCENWDRDWNPRGAADDEHFCQLIGKVTTGDWFCADGKHGVEPKEG